MKTLEQTPESAAAGVAEWRGGDKRGEFIISSVGMAEGGDNRYSGRTCNDILSNLPYAIKSTL